MLRDWYHKKVAKRFRLISVRKVNSHYTVRICSGPYPKSGSIDHYLEAVDREQTHRNLTLQEAEVIVETWKKRNRGYIKGT